MAPAAILDFAERSIRATTDHCLDRGCMPGVAVLVMAEHAVRCERADWFRKDPRLASIRQDPRFQVIINSIEARRKQRQQK